MRFGHTNTNVDSIMSIVSMHVDWFDRNGNCCSTCGAHDENTPSTVAVHLDCGGAGPPLASQQSG